MLMVVYKVLTLQHKHKHPAIKNKMFVEFKNCVEI